MSKSDGIQVSREVLETMLRAVTETHDSMPTVFIGEPFEQGQTLAQLMTKLVDVQITLESLCDRLS